MVASSLADWAPVILAVGSFVSATAGAIVLLYNTLRRDKRIEKKIDTAVTTSADNAAKLATAEVVQEKIHVAVNGGLAALRADNAALKLEVARLRALLPPATPP